MTAILQIANIVSQSLELSSAQIENLKTMHAVARQAEQEDGGAILAGMSIGWFMNSSATKIDANVSQLIELLSHLDIDLQELEETICSEERFPDGDPLAFIEESIELVHRRQKALLDIKNLLLENGEALERRLAPWQIQAMEARRDNQLHKLLD